MDRGRDIQDSVGENECGQVGTVGGRIRSLEDTSKDGAVET